MSFCIWHIAKGISNSFHQTIFQEFPSGGIEIYVTPYNMCSIRLRTFSSYLCLRYRAFLMKAPFRSLCGKILALFDINVESFIPAIIKNSICLFHSHFLSPSLTHTHTHAHAQPIHIHTHTHIYIYINVCVCACV